MRKLFYPLIVALFIAGSSTASAALAQAVGCPTITVEGTPDAPCSGTPLTFTAKVAGLNSGVKLTYEWAITVGTIESGQGTDTIKVETVGIPGQSIKATVKVVGINAACDNTASQEAATAVCCLRGPFDMYGNLSFKDEKARLDNVALELENQPEAKIYIMAYAGRITFPDEAIERAERAKNYLTSERNIFDDRIVTMDGGYREDLTVEIWILPSEATPPTVTPTLSPEEVQMNERPAKGSPARRRNR